MLPERPKAARSELSGEQVAHQPRHGVAIDVHSVQEPARVLMLVVALLGLGQMTAHRAHALGKGLDRVEQGGLFEILHHLVTKRDGIEIAQRHAEERRQVIVVLAGRNRGDDLIKIEIDKAVRRGTLLVRSTVGGSLKEDAMEGHRPTPRRPTSLDGREAIPWTARGGTGG